MKIKLIILSTILLIICGLGISTHILSNRLNDTRAELELALTNNKAYESEKDSLKQKNIQFQFTIDQLNYSNDSLVRKLNQTRNQLKIKDKDIKELQYIVSENNKTDSIFVHDTIFRENVVLDTSIFDKWAKIDLHLAYPGEILTNYSFINQTTIITSSKKETIDPPKKCWIGRLFQKKHTVVNIDVVQENPYCENKEQTFIKIIE